MWRRYLLPLTAIDEQGRVLSLTSDWSCWSDGESAVELGPTVAGNRPTALPGGGFAVHGRDGDVQVWTGPAAPEVAWSVDAPLFELQPDATGQHMAIRGNGDVTVLHRAGGTREVLPRDQTREELRTSIAWSPQGSTLGVLQPYAGDLELTLWNGASEPVQRIEHHLVADTPADTAAYFAFTPSGAALVFADRPTSLTILQRADGSTRRVPLPTWIHDAHFLAEDRLLAVDHDATPMLIDLTTAEAVYLQGDARNGTSSEVQFGQADPGAPVWMCHALGLGTLVRWTDVVPDTPADMQAWLRGAVDSPR